MINMEPSVLSCGRLNPRIKKDSAALLETRIENELTSAKPPGYYSVLDASDDPDQSMAMEIHPTRSGYRN